MPTCTYAVPLDLSFVMKAPVDFTTSALVVLALTAGMSEAIRERRAGIAERVWAKADYPRSARPAVKVWLVPQREVGAILLYLLLCIAVVTGAVVAGGVAAGLALALLLSFFALVIGGTAGRAVAMRLGPATPQLLWLARRAATKAAADEDAVALAVAQWIEWFDERAPSVTAATLDAYSTPKQVAGVLADHYFGSADEHELRVWLRRADAPLWAGPEEDSRVALLQRIRGEMLDGGGERFADLDRVRAFVDELDRWSPGPTP
jgi:hypothetical protein